MPSRDKRRDCLFASALAVLAPWPAARSTLPFFQLLLGPANAARSGRLLLGILDPADELVAGQRRDVLPGIEYSALGGERLSQVCWKLVHHPTGHLRATHSVTVAAVPSTAPATSPAAAGSTLARRTAPSPAWPPSGWNRIGHSDPDDDMLHAYRNPIRAGTSMTGSRWPSVRRGMVRCSSWGS